MPYDFWRGYVPYTLCGRVFFFLSHIFEKNSGSSFYTLEKVESNTKKAFVSFISELLKRHYSRYLSILVKTLGAERGQTQKRRRFLAKFFLYSKVLFVFLCSELSCQSTSAQRRKQGSASLLTKSE